MTSNPPPLAGESYISLETFRKDGSGVKTPVWAAPLDGHLVIFTEASSYKVKRLRNDPKIRAAACDVRGKVRGDWFDGTARILEDKDQIESAHRAIRAKYGFLGAVTDFFSRLTGKIGKRAYLEVTFTS
jgi:PPOX class probable F420-dependent enzyme